MALPKRQKIVLSLIAVLVIILMYLMQRFNYCALVFGIWDLELPSTTFQFIFNRTLRYIINDFSVILLIYAIFESKSLIKIAFGLQFIGLFIVLPIYFYFKLSLEGPTELSSPLLSFIHRIVVNPILMLLLIPGYYYQQRHAK